MKTNQVVCAPSSGSVVCDTVIVCSLKRSGSAVFVSHIKCESEGKKIDCFESMQNC